MKKLFKLGALVGVGCVIGYLKGSKDVMRENKIASFTKKLFKGNFTITLCDKDEES